jgi:hypothetical protein
VGGGWVFGAVNVNPGVEKISTLLKKEKIPQIHLGFTLASFKSMEFLYPNSRFFYM